MSQVKIRLDGREILAEEGRVLLDVALENGAFIPHLCHLPHLEDAYAGCRLCFVEVEGVARPITSCTERVRPGMVVRTDTPLVRRLQRSALRLLLSTHRVACEECPANKRCGLQEMARKLKVKLKVKGLRDLSAAPVLDATLGRVLYDPSKCVLCGICVRLCSEEGTGGFHFSQRGLKTRIAPFAQGGDPELLERCRDACPVGALLSAQEATQTDPGEAPTGHPLPATAPPDRAPM
jgi:formate dehydrogenase major subunit/NADH-quinone oxidoreductase subunit G